MNKKEGRLQENKIKIKENKRKKWNEIINNVGNTMQSRVAYLQFWFYHMDFWDFDSLPYGTWLITCRFRMDAVDSWSSGDYVKRWSS